MNKPQLIILEGVDKVGKTTVYQRLRKITEYEPLVIDRFHASNFAYDIFWGRSHHIKNYFEKDKQLDRIYDVYYIYLVCAPDVLFKRLKKEENLKSKPIIGINKIDKLFKMYFDITPLKKMVIDTSYPEPGVVVNHILNFIGSGNTLEDLTGAAWKKTIRDTKLPEGWTLDAYNIYYGNKK